MRWGTRISLTIVSTAALAAAGLAFADPDPGSALGAAGAATDWSDGPVKDITDPSTGQYQFEGQMIGGANRAVASASGRYTVDRLTDADALRVELQALYDGVLHDRPNPPDNNLQETPNPDLLPDWDGDGDYGREDPADYDRDLDAPRDVGRFRYPTFYDDGTITHELATDGTPKTGLAAEVGFFNSRGLFIDATLWFPSYPEDGTHWPAIALANGVSSSQVDYYWFAESMAARGYVVLTYDPVGQGQSEGTWSDTFQQGTATGDCNFGGACLDVQDAVRWLVGDTIVPRTDLMGFENGQMRPFNPAAAALVGQPANLMTSHVERANVGLAGNSMGALSILNYLTALDTPGSDLPKIKAAVAMSGATASATSRVPLQLQTSDFDGSPTLVGPGVGGVNLGGAGQGIGYYIVKDMFDRLRSEATAADLSLVVLAGGVHTDHVNVPYVPRTLWATHLASHYAGAWFDCYIKGLPCGATTTGIPHLSTAFGSELDPTGTDPAVCLVEPSTMSINYDAQDLAALRPRTCHGRAPALTAG